MEKHIKYFTILIIMLFFTDVLGQSNVKDPSSSVSTLFSNIQPLPIKLSYSIRDLKKNTNDSTYFEIELFYSSQKAIWHKINTRIRVRGNSRLKNCYFPPLKVKIKKSEALGTPFEGHKNLKIVQPCLIQKSNNDNVIKEYLAYKLYEIISPYNFQTRLLNIDFEETKGNKTKSHGLIGFFIEDDKSVAKRLNAKVYDRNVHPLAQEQLTCVRHDIFQFMIGNTDYSQADLHNVKLIYLDKQFTPIPYDFDMSGFVNATYAVVPEINGKSMKMSSVKDRMFRGFKRDNSVYDNVRSEFRAHKVEMLDLLTQHSKYFNSMRDFEIARAYILGFFEILENDVKFKEQILDVARKG